MRSCGREPDGRRGTHPGARHRHSSTAQHPSDQLLGRTNRTQCRTHAPNDASLAGELAKGAGAGARTPLTPHARATPTRPPLTQLLHASRPIGASEEGARDPHLAAVSLDAWPQAYECGGGREADSPTPLLQTHHSDAREQRADRRERAAAPQLSRKGALIPAGPHERLTTYSRTPDTSSGPAREIGSLVSRNSAAI
jgi:hypothetical protein